MGLINNNANSEFLYKSSQLITLIQRDDGKKKQTMAQKARLSSISVFFTFIDNCISSIKT